MNNLTTHGRYYDLLSEGKTPPKKMRVDLNAEGERNWQALLVEIKTPDLLDEVTL